MHCLHRATTGQGRRYHPVSLRINRAQLALEVVARVPALACPQYITGRKGHNRDVRARNQPALGHLCSDGSLRALPPHRMKTGFSRRISAMILQGQARG